MEQTQEDVGISGCVGGIQPGGWRDRKKIENLTKQNVL